MFSAIPDKREFKLRQTILKGVYEDNLRTIGKRPGTLRRQPSRQMGRTFLFFTILILGVLGSGNYSDLSSLQRKHMIVTAGAVARGPVSPPFEPSMNPRDYAGFLDGDQPLSRVFGLEVKTIMIDPGHGGSDSGSIGKMGTLEKDITLDIAKRLRQRLARRGFYNVILTREEDTTLPLTKRVDLANSEKADIFVSIHVNYLPLRPINIIETYYFGPSTDAKILKLAEQENASSHYKLSEVKEMVERIGEMIKLQESRTLAESIQKSLFTNSRRQNGSVQDFGVKRAPFVVLLGAQVPAVLAEVSCLSNREEELDLNTESHRENIARYLEAGILDYLSKGEVHHEAKRVEERR